MTASIGNKRRVLIIVENLPVPFDRRVWAEATTLASAGYEVSVISPMMGDATAPYEMLDNVHIYRHPLREADASAFGYLREYASALFWQYRLALKVRRERGFDVIHACNPPDLIFLVAAFFKIFGVKFIFDHHDLCPELYEAKFNKRGLFWRFLKVVEKATFALADVTIATNHSYKRIAVERGGMASERVFVVRSGPRLEKLEIRPPRQELKKGAKFLIGYVGVIGEQEGVDLLIEAAAHLLQRRGKDSAHFAIIGDGPALETAKRLVAENKLEDAFTFTGRASDDLLLDLLNTADVCVNSDRWSEMNDKSTMNKIMEYMALRKPIVQFDLYEGRQSARDASLYAAPDNAADFAEKIGYLLDRPEERERMGRVGRERIENRLSWVHSVPVLLAAYDRVFGNTARLKLEAGKERTGSKPQAQIETGPLSVGGEK
ncbi:MAG: glycosyltransferase family 4 protein [Pseudomonadota bacterium]